MISSSLWILLGNIFRETRPVVENAIKEVYTTLLPKTTIIGDLGCAAGPNTLLFVSSVTSTIVELCKSSGDDYVELQFFLNDLPGNDFNELFRSIEKFKRPNITGERAHLPSLYYIQGLSESYYNRLFPMKVSTYSTLHTAFIGAPRYLNH
jgi:hypothetical protein